MEWIAEAWKWLRHEVAHFGMLELGLLIVGGIVGSLVTWWRHRTLKGQIRSLHKAIDELKDMIRDMPGRPADEQRRIVAKAEEITLRASASTGVATVTGNLSKSPRDRDDWN